MALGQVDPFFHAGSVEPLDLHPACLELRKQSLELIVAGDLYLQAYIETLWRTEVDKLIRNLINEGKEQGYIDTSIADQTIQFYFEILRNGAFSSKEMLEQLKVDGNLARELNNLFMFGLVQKKD